MSKKAKRGELMAMLEDTQCRLDIANRTVCEQIDAIVSLNAQLDEAEFRVLVTKADAFDLLVARG
jgi:hypothetical protein